MTDPRLNIATQFVNSWPHCVELGVKVLDVGDGFASLSLPYHKRLIGDPETGVLHGGVISTLLDSTSGAAVILHPEFGNVTATLDLRIDYMRPATPDQNIMASAHVYHVTRTVAFVRGLAFDDDRSKPVATATGAFTFSKLRRSSSEATS